MKLCYEDDGDTNNNINSYKERYLMKTVMVKTMAIMIVMAVVMIVI